MSEVPSDDTTPITVDQMADNLLKSALAADKAGDTDEPSEPQETQEEAPKSDTDSGEESESDEPQADAEAPAPELRKLKVKIDGVEEELPEDEVVKGYQRNADYTRKTQAAAELRKSLEADAAAVKAERSQYAAHLNDLKSALESMQGKEPDWESLKQGDPATFAATYTSWKIGQDNIAKVASEQANVAARERADAARERSTMLERESEKLKEMIPSWKDDAVAKQEKTDLVSYARSKGFTDEELANVTDARTLGLLRDAWLGAKKTAAIPAVKAKIEAVKVAAPGAVAPTSRSKEKVAEEAAKRVAKTGKSDDFADWLVKRGKL